MDVMTALLAAGGVVALLGLVVGWFTYTRSQEQAAKQVQTVQHLIDRASAKLPASEVAPGAPGGAHSRGWEPGQAQEAMKPLLDGIASRTKARFDLQSEYYADALRQSSLYFACSLVTSSFGFALLSTGAGLGLAGKADVGLVSAIGGIVAEAAATLVFVQANRAKSDAQQNLTSLITATEADEKRLMAYLYASQIGGEETRDAAYAELARGLMNTATRSTLATI